MDRPITSLHLQKPIQLPTHFVEQIGYSITTLGDVQRAVCEQTGVKVIGVEQRHDGAGRRRHVTTVIARVPPSAAGIDPMMAVNTASVAQQRQRLVVLSMPDTGDWINHINSRALQVQPPAGHHRKPLVDVSADCEGKRKPSVTNLDAVNAEQAKGSKVPSPEFLLAIGVETEMFERCGEDCATVVIDDLEGRCFGISRNHNTL